MSTYDHNELFSERWAERDSAAPGLLGRHEPTEADMVIARTAMGKFIKVSRDRNDQANLALGWIRGAAQGADLHGAAQAVRLVRALFAAMDESRASGS